MNASIGCQNPRLLSYRNGSNSKLVIRLDEPKLWDKGWNRTFTSVQAGPWVSLLRVYQWTRSFIGQLGGGGYDTIPRWVYRYEGSEAKRQRE